MSNKIKVLASFGVYFVFKACFLLKTLRGIDMEGVRKTVNIDNTSLYLIEGSFTANTRISREIGPFREAY